MSEPTLKDKTAKGLFWGGLSNLIQQFIGMVFGIAIARILSPDDYGLVAMLAVFSAIANTLMDSGFSMALINKNEFKHEDYNAVFWFSIGISLVAYLILFFAAPSIAKFYNEPVLTNLSRLIFISFIFAGSGIAHNALLVKQLKVKQRGIIDVTSVLSSGAIGLVMALNGYAFWGLAVQQLTQNFVGTVLRWYFSGWRPTFTFNFAPIKEMFGFSSKLLANSILAQITGNLFNIILGHNYGKEDTGYYAQGNKWMFLGFTTITGMIKSVAQPVLVEVKEDLNRQVVVYRKMLRFGAFVSFPAMLGLAFVASEFITLTIGSKWENSVIYLQVLSIAMSFEFLTTINVTLLLSHGYSNWLLKYSFFINIITLLILFVCSPFGILTMVVVYSIWRIISAFSWIFFVIRILPISFFAFLKDIGSYLGVAVLSFIIGLFATKLVNGGLGVTFILKIVSVGVSYVFLLYILGSAAFKEVLYYLFHR